MRTRFPPSPTGFLHVGGLRTALYNYLLARQTKGTFLIRIEDTDQTRSVEGAVENLLEGLHWASIHPDEGVMLENGKVTEKGSHGPYFQSKRLDFYKKHAEELIAKGHAYHCFCAPERLDQMREEQESRKQAPMYDRQCLRLKPDEVQAKLKEGVPHVVRMKVPHERTITFTDDIRGELTFQGHTIDDQVLLKSDGFPTYHLAHVVDDHLMEIDLVMRGEEWLSSLPKHLLLFEFLGWTPPKYAHVPLLLNKDRTKLSKRDNSVAVEEYIKKGYLPEALVNFLALLGWNPGTSRAARSGTGHRPGTTREIFSMEDLVAQFSLSRVQKAGAIFDLEKLDWLQGQWMRKLPPQDFAARIQPIVVAEFPAAASDADFVRKAEVIQGRITFFSEAPGMLKFFYDAPKLSMDLLVNAKQKVAREMLPAVLDLLSYTLTGIPQKEWKLDMLKNILEKTAKDHQYSLGQILWPLRAALTGLPYSPGAFEVAVLLGREETLRRLEKAKTAVS